MFIVNQGDEPTFLTSNRKDFFYKFSNWFVFNECFFSDHRYVTFIVDTIAFPLDVTLSVNRRNTNSLETNP